MEQVDERSEEIPQSGRAWSIRQGEYRTRNIDF